MIILEQWRAPSPWCCRSCSCSICSQEWSYFVHMVVEKYPTAMLVTKIGVWSILEQA